ncbi:MAG: hypothetical protein KGZ63_04075 [Clostridiales bacterium]|nr:hypothetical protein [Clostridiales bacterium]
MSEDYYFEDEKPSEAEQAFSSTTSKKNLSGVRGRASRTGRKGAIMTPVDFLRGKAKKEYMQNSEVKVYNMYESKVIPYDEFKELPIEKQVVLMTKWREEIGTNNIIKDLKISRKKFYSDVLTSLGIETKPRGNSKRLRESKQSFESESSDQRIIDVYRTNQDEVNTSSNESFSLALNGFYNGQTLANKISRVAKVIDFNDEYEVIIQVRQISKL